jgi:FKBP-type peptidyl-prolyl cis-trans isomerase SlyD
VIYQRLKYYFCHLLIGMKIGPGTSAKIIYNLMIVENGNQVEQMAKDQSATFRFGFNQLLPEFEARLNGMENGQKFDFVLSAEKAYGPVDPYAIFDVPKDTFEHEGKIDENMLQVGNLIPMRDNDGNEHLGRIIIVLDTVVTMDFNHQLAGRDLRFTGEVIDVKNI